MKGKTIYETAFSKHSLGHNVALEVSSVGGYLGSKYVSGPSTHAFTGALSAAVDNAPRFN